MPGRTPPVAEPGTPRQPRSDRESGQQAARVNPDERSPEIARSNSPREVLEAEVVQDTRAIRRLLSRQVTLMRDIHIGPLPPAREFKAYEAIHPGSADRILAMAESELAHGQQMEREVLAADKEIASRGQHYALMATVFLGGLGAALGFAGRDWLGATFVVSSLVPIVAHFLARGAAEPRSKPKPDQSRSDRPSAPRRTAWDEPGPLETSDVKARESGAGRKTKSPGIRDAGTGH